MNADRVWTAPYYPNNAQERHYRRATPAAKQPRTYVGDLERAQSMLEYPSGRGIPIPDYSTTGPHSEAYTVNQWRERQDGDLIPPPKSAKRSERASGPSLLTSQQARHLADLQLDEVCRTEARERKRSLESRRQVEMRKAVDNAGDVEKQDEESTDIPDLDPNRYRPFTCSKTFNRFFDWIAMSPSFYAGVIMLVVFLATTLFLALRPPRSLEVMRLDTKHLFNGVNYNSHSFIARNCRYELLPPGSRVALGNTSDVGRHRPLRLNRDDANITIPDHIELYMFSACYNGVFGRQCHFGTPLLPLNWNITSVVERSIKPTFKGLDDTVQSGLVNAALKEEFVKIINQKVAEANPDPARIDMLGWGWPMVSWPKPSSFFAEKEKGLNRTVLLLDQYIFDGEVRTGNATSTPYSVILLIFVVGICFLGIVSPCLFVMSGVQVNYVPCWLGYVGVGVPVATLAIVGVSLENGASGWNPTRCALVQYAGLALRPFWVRDYLHWYFWAGTILFGAFALAYLIRRIFSRHSLADTQDLGSWGFGVFWILSFLALIAAIVTGHRSMKTKAQAINSISGYLGMIAVPGKGYWIAVCVAEFLGLWIGLAFLSHALKFRFREDEKFFKTSENRYSGAGVRTRSGARISAPIMAPSMTRSREKTKTPEAMPEEVEADGSPTERRPSTIKQDAERLHNEDVDIMVKEIEALVGENKGTGTENLRGSEDKARAISEALVDKEQSEHESGVAMSSVRRSLVSCTVPNRELSNDKREEGEEVDNQQGADQQHHEHSDSEHRVSEHGGSNHQDSQHRNSQHGNNEHQDADDNTVDNVSTDNVEENEELRDEPGPIHGRSRADTSFRWSAPASASDSGRTTRGSWNQPRTPSVSPMDYQQSERYDAADESSRSGTPMSRLRLQRDSTSGRTRHLTEGGHVFDMVQRLSRHEE
ncbi:hypothetical protein E2P81_ATG00007 [Venturia nashicola]|uniref:Uncharacterized protein n=1 Tax=Venturia nashicola TaxID=86259 RepID=A0A4Z1PMJ8_9PEZI|nr:hypothetical protein E6O75_ATG00011 [Venturia nashicola]TLD39020.1 hypothetical protein E2P81_ATG00007 [Venturia nashicola]